MRLRIDDLGGGGETSAVLNIRIDGKPFGNRMRARCGKNTDIRVPVSHEGENLIELSASRGPAELHHAEQPRRGHRLGRARPAARVCWYRASLMPASGCGAIS